jgi:hypothetical protein
MNAVALKSGVRGGVGSRCVGSGQMLSRHVDAAGLPLMMTSDGFRCMDGPGPGPGPEHGIARRCGGGGRAVFCVERAFSDSRAWVGCVARALGACGVA